MPTLPPVAPEGDVMMSQWKLESRPDANLVVKSGTSGCRWRRQWRRGYDDSQGFSKPQHIRMVLFGFVLLCMPRLFLSGLSHWHPGNNMIDEMANI